MLKKNIEEILTFPESGIFYLKYKIRIAMTNCIQFRNNRLLYRLNNLETEPSKRACHLLGVTSHNISKTLKAFDLTYFFFKSKINRLQIQ